MLSIRVVHPGVADDRQSMRLINVADAHQGGHTADPLNIRLKDIDKALTGSQCEWMDGVPMFTRGENLSWYALPYLHIAVHIFR